MARIARAPIMVGGVVLACAGCVKDDAECNGFGCPSSADAGESATVTSAGSSDGTSDDGPTTLVSSGIATTTTTDPSATSDADDTTTSPEGSSSDAADDTTGPPCRGANCPALGECFGVGVWQSCTQYCEAGKATCVEAGCGGATVVYYGDANACVDMRSNGESDQSCDAPFDQGGGAVSFGRCCCE